MRAERLDNLEKLSTGVKEALRGFKKQHRYVVMMLYSAHLLLVIRHKYGTRPVFNV